MWKSKTNRKNTSIERGGSWDREMALWGQNGGKGKMAEGEMRCTSCTFLFFFSSPVFCSSCFFYRGTVVSPFALFFFCRCFTSVCFACVLLCFASGTFLQTVYATSLPHVDPKYTSQAARLLPPSPPPLLLFPPCGPEIDVASGFVAVSFGGNIWKKVLILLFFFAYSGETKVSEIKSWWRRCGLKRCYKWSKRPKKAVPKIRWTCRNGPETR